MRRKIPIRTMLGRPATGVALSSTAASPAPVSAPERGVEVVTASSGSDLAAVEHDPHSTWVPPEPSRASRGIALRSTASYRGSIVHSCSGREFNFESKLERDFLHIALARQDIADIQEQPPAVAFVDEDGRASTHTFDALVTLTDGRRIAVDVKPRSKVARSGILTVQRLIREQLGTSFADLYIVRTEDHIHPDDVVDAQWILRARRLPDGEADRAVGEVLQRLHGWCRISDLVDAVELGPSAFNAALRLIGAGSLEVRGGTRIAPNSFVRRARA